jgi:dTDP-4-dehydrorhamnose 3,5-epimerase
VPGSKLKSPFVVLSVGVLMPFSFKRLEIEDVVLVEAKAFGDERGFFMETYKRSEFQAVGIPPFVQDNFSHSTRGVLRGLHYQLAPAAQGKLVSVVHGEIFDVAVDVRQDSPSFGQWVAEVLSAADHRMLYVPAGFAHGFCVLSDEADVLYKVTHEYSPENDRGVRWDDPDLGIEWPISEPILSLKDAAQPYLQDADIDFVYHGDAG